MSKSAPGVLMIGWEYPPHNSGGLGVACEGISKAVVGLQSQVYFTLPHAFSGSAPHMQVLDCSDPSWELSGAAGMLPPFEAYATASNAKKQSSALSAFSDLSPVIPQSEMEAKVAAYANMVTKQATTMQDKFDVIHAHDWMSFPAGIEVQKKTGKPLIAHIHSTEYDRIPSGSGSPYIIHTEQEGLRHADRVIAVSTYTKQLLVSRYGVAPEKIAVVHNGITPLTAEWQNTTTDFIAERPVIVFMGRLTAQKGAHYFIALAQAILQKVPTALFVVAGSGDMYHELLFHTADSRLTASVIFSGFIRDTQREKLLDRANVFVMPSLSEPFGLVALEAAQRHTPVLVSKTSGVGEVMPGSIAVDFWDVEKMSKLITELLTNKPYSAAVVSSQLADTSKITWDTAAERLMGVYRSTFVPG